MHPQGGGRNSNRERKRGGRKSGKGKGGVWFGNLYRIQKTEERSVKRKDLFYRKGSIFETTRRDKEKGLFSQRPQEENQEIGRATNLSSPLEEKGRRIKDLEKEELEREEEEGGVKKKGGEPFPQGIFASEFLQGTSADAKA